MPSFVVKTEYVAWGSVGRMGGKHSPVCQGRGQPKLSSLILQCCGCGQKLMCILTEVSCIARYGIE